MTMITSLNKYTFKWTLIFFMFLAAGLVFFTGNKTLYADSPAFNLNDVDQPPSIISASVPKYPIEALGEGIEGKVVLRFIVDANGYAQEPEVVKAEPEGVFDDAALDAIINYKFKPAVKDGKNVSCIVRLPVKFALGHEDKKIFSSAYRVSEVDKPPKLIRIEKPEYPASAKEQGIEGQVIVRFVVGANGYVRDAKILSAIPSGVFEDYVLQALADAEFEPAVKDGKDVDCIITFPIRFPPGELNQK